MTSSDVLLFLAVIQVKHNVLDFIWQPPYEWQNKGTYGHPGGLVHSGKHAIASFLIVAMFVPASLGLAILLSVLDFVIHYHVDWAKMNLNRYLDADPTKPVFWELVGHDQMLHQLTYAIMLYSMLIR